MKPLEFNFFLPSLKLSPETKPNLYVLSHLDWLIWIIYRQHATFMYQKNIQSHYIFHIYSLKSVLNVIRCQILFLLICFANNFHFIFLFSKVCKVWFQHAVCLLKMKMPYQNALILYILFSCTLSALKTNNHLPDTISLPFISFNDCKKYNGLDKTTHIPKSNKCHRFYM